MRRVTISLVTIATTLAIALPAAALEPRVVGGSDAPAGKFPYVANVNVSALGFGAFGCTGTLIAPQWVVTAGHCVSITGGNGIPTPLTYPAGAYSVILGTENSDGSGGEHHAVRSVHLDPGYSITGGTGSDVGLLELDKPSQIAPMPIAAPSESSIWEPGDTLTIAGFGVTTTDGETPDRLQYAQVPRVDDAGCAAAYSDPTPVIGNAFDPGTAICAGLPQGGVDTCQGDSGGPLLAPLGDGFRLIGATSYGEGCAEPGKPGVYARLAEGSVKSFVAGLVPEAYATPGAEPEPTPPPANTTCEDPVRYRVKKPSGARMVRAAVFIGGQRVAFRAGRRLKSFTLRLQSQLAPTRSTRVRIVRVASDRSKRVTILVYDGCEKSRENTKLKRA